MGQYNITQSCATSLRRSVCTTVVLGDEGGCSKSSIDNYE